MIQPHPIFVNSESVDSLNKAPCCTVRAQSTLALRTEASRDSFELCAQLFKNNVERSKTASRRTPSPYSQNYERSHPSSQASRFLIPTTRKYKAARNLIVEREGSFRCYFVRSLNNRAGGCPDRTPRRWNQRRQVDHWRAKNSTKPRKVPQVLSEMEVPQFVSRKKQEGRPPWISKIVLP